VAAVRLGANITGDSDSVASIAGGILGARLGSPALPADWVARLENREQLKNVAERLVIRNSEGAIEVNDLPMNLRIEPQPLRASVPGVRSTADVLYDRLVQGRESFWSTVYAPFMSRDMTRDDLRALVRKGLEQTAGNYRLLTGLFNMPEPDYKRFLNFLRKHHCHVAFQQFRTLPGRPLTMTSDGVAERDRPQRNDRDRSFSKASA